MMNFNSLMTESAYMQARLLREAAALRSVCEIARNAEDASRSAYPVHPANRPRVRWTDVIARVVGLRHRLAPRSS